MTPEEVAEQAYSAGNLVTCDGYYEFDLDAAVSVIRTAMEAYAAEKVAEERALADRQLYTRDKFIVDQGLWDAFLSTLPAANQHHGGNDADT